MGPSWDIENQGNWREKRMRRRESQGAGRVKRTRPRAPLHDGRKVAKKHRVGKPKQPNDKPSDAGGTRTVHRVRDEAEKRGGPAAHRFDYPGYAL